MITCQRDASRARQVYVQMCQGASEIDIARHILNASPSPAKQVKPLGQGQSKVSHIYIYIYIYMYIADF